MKETGDYEKRRIKYARQVRKQIEEYIEAKERYEQEARNLKTELERALQQIREEKVGKLLR